MGSIEAMSWWLIVKIKIEFYLDYYALFMFSHRAQSW